MKAILRTLCGCERTQGVTFPPPREIVLPLRSDRLSVWFDEDTPPANVYLKMRRFELCRAEGGPYGTAEYLEKE